MRALLRDLLQLLAVAALVVAQPLLDLLGRQPEFWVVRRSGPLEVVLVLGVLLLVAPLPLLVVRAAAAPLGEGAAARVQALLVGALAGLLALQAAREWGPPWWWAAPLVVSVAVAAAYLRLAPVRLYASFLVPAVVVVPLLFLLQPGVRRALAPPADGEAVVLGEVEATAPVLVVIFDELPLAALLDAEGAIDAERFPNVAALAARSTWFRNAFAASDDTQTAVPALLTGRYPRRDQLPNLADHPVNLFTLLGGSYEVFAEESITRLCPAHINRLAEGEQPVDGRLISLLRDAGVVWLHRSLPPPWRERLPRIDQGWGGFAPPASAAATPADRGGFHVAGVRAIGARAEQLRSLPQWLTADPRRLYVFHVLLPHVPWEYLADGRRYWRGRDLYPPIGGAWPRDPRAAAEGYARFRQQLAYTDRWLGVLLERLRQQGALDDALIAVAADHGAAFTPGLPYRFLSRATAPQVAAVPMFVKAPGQRQGRQVARPLSAVDFLPTLLDALGVPAPAGLDGVSGLAAAASRPPPRFLGQDGSLRALPRDLPQRVRTAAVELRALAKRCDAGTGVACANHPLAGRRVAELGVLPPGHERLRLDEPPPRVPEQPLPLPVSGVVEDVGDGACCSLAVAVDGVVRAVGVTVPSVSGQHRFSILLPPDSPPTAAREIFLVGRDGFELQRLQRDTIASGSILMDGEGRPEGLLLGSRRYRLSPGLSGWIERVEPTERGLRVRGWAVDRERVAPAEMVVVFVGGRLVGWGMPSIPHQGVVDQLGDRRYEESQFDLYLAAVDAEELAAHGGRVFAVDDRGVAAELGSVHPFQRLDAEQGRLALVAPNGRRVAVRPRALRVQVDEVRRDPEGLALVGWAADPDARVGASGVAVFLDGRFLTRVPTGARRPDVAAAWGSEEVATCGFRLPITDRLVEVARQGRLRAFALSRTQDAATELPVREALARWQPAAARR